MANEFKTSRKTELVALRAAESAGYLTVGSKKYFKDQLKNKRNGKTFEFVIRDAGEYQRGIDLSGKGPSSLVEKKVAKTLNVGNVMIATNLIEKVTDVNWDKEVAIPQGKKLINGVVNDTINGFKGKTVDGEVVSTYDGDFGNQNLAFAGIGYGPLTDATNSLAAISDESQYMFINPMINSKLSNTGDAFKPTSADPIFSKGLIGKIGETEVRTNQFLPLVIISSALANDYANITGVTYAESGLDDGLATLTFAGMSQKFPKGSVVWIDGAYAADLVGDRTASLRAFIAVEDGTANGVMVVKALSAEDWTGEGNKVICDSDGKAFGATKSAAISAFNTVASKTGAVQGLEAGKYFSGIVRLDGTMEFEMLDEIDASNADTERADNEGVVVFQNRAVDTIKGSNVTRWTSTVMAGIVEPRGVALVLVKDADTNKVKVVS